MAGSLQDIKDQGAQLGPKSNPHPLPPPPLPAALILFSCNADALLAPYRYQAQPLTEETLLEEQQRAEAMLQAASDGIAPQDLPHSQPGEYLAQHMSAATLYNHVMQMSLFVNAEVLQPDTVLMISSAQALLTLSLFVKVQA